MVDEPTFKITEVLNPWDVNRLWGKFIAHLENINKKCIENSKPPQYDDVQHLENYRFVGVDESLYVGDDWIVYVDTDYDDFCVGGEALSIFISTVIKDHLYIEFYDDNYERWGWYITPGQVRMIEYELKPGLLHYATSYEGGELIIERK